MRIPTNPIHPMAVFWCLVYALALFFVFVAGILAWSREWKPTPAKGSAGGNIGCKY